ncbi:MAG: short-chain dehydrogenase [Actinomycetia bacterium]|nr:short-chain dehydrogenase [Actinomycetes bacterium]
MIEPGDVLLEGRVAVVTGAAVGLGEAIALGLARFGCDVAICDRDEENLKLTAEAVRAVGREAITAVLDVRDEVAVGAFGERISAEYGRVHVLVNNAGGTFQRPFLDMSAGAESAIVRENFTSVTNFVKTCAPLMTDGGSIINLTSIEAHRASPLGAVYGAMKAAVAHLSKTLAIELGGQRIRVNCIAPDFIPTPGLGGFDVPPPWTAIPRMGHTDDVVGAALWLAGPLSSFVTGMTVHVDGGKIASGGWYRDDAGAYLCQ